MTEVAYYQFHVYQVEGPRHPAQGEADDDKQHGFYDIDLRLRHTLVLCLALMSWPDLFAWT